MSSNMLNSVAKYLWGSGSDHEQEYTDTSKLEETHGTGEHLETQQDEDWILVEAAVADKENSGQPSLQGSHHHLHPYHSHHHLHHVQQLASLGGHESLSQNSSGASDAEQLDDAATLAESMAMEAGKLTGDSDTPCSPLQDCGCINQDMDKYSDTESLPESVFSASSNKSHATYHPHGKRSEPWVVAPPPCFTGSQVGELSPIASSPLENLLIEHPSMSVYLSVPFSTPIAIDFPIPYLTPAGRRLMEEEERENREHQRGLREESSQDEGFFDTLSDPLGPPIAEVAVLPRENSLNHAAPRRHVITQQEQMALEKRIHKDQCVQHVKAQKLITSKRCERHNKVHEYNGHAKGNNRRNKRVRPSGFRASRFSQRM